MRSIGSARRAARAAPSSWLASAVLVASIALPGCSLERLGFGGTGELDGGPGLDAWSPSIDATTPMDDATLPVDDAASLMDAADAPFARDAARPDGCGAVDLCDGADDDCDPTTADGATDPRVGAPCDGIDADECEDGVFVCTGGALACTDDGTSVNEICNRLDDDCDGAVDELGPELCNGLDDDCDTIVDESGALDALTWYVDFDLDGHGDSTRSARACAQPEGYVASSDDCDDTRAAVNPGATELCDGEDEDCSGLRDDNGACAPCTPQYRGGHIYQLCPSGRGFGGALAACGAVGYHLVSIEDAAENTWLESVARPSIGRYWIGVNQRDGEWIRVIDGARQTYLPWAPGEPNDGDSPSIVEDCVEVGAFVGAAWNDAVCSNVSAWVCER